MADKKKSAPLVKPRTPDGANLTIRMPADELAALRFLAEHERIAVTHLMRRYAREGFRRAREELARVAKPTPKELLPW